MTAIAWTMEATKAAIRDAVLELAATGCRIAETYEIKAKPRFATAAWVYAPPHRIYVGTDIACKARPGLTEAEVGLYIQRHVFHEVSHLLWTDRDLAELKKYLPPDVSFSLFNAFEDARIEECYRRERRERFEWVRFEAVADDLSPNALFFALVQHDGDAEDVRSTLEGALATDPQAPARFDRVLGYYERAIAASDSRALFPILADWAREFPSDCDNPRCRGAEGDGHRLGDLVPGLLGQEQDRSFAAFDADTEFVSGTVPSAGARPARVDLVAEPDSAMLLTETPVGAVDASRVAAVARRLAGLFEAKTRMVTGPLPSARLSVRHLVLNQPAYRRRETTSLARQRVLLVMDCSGSMSGQPVDEGRVLVAALSELAQRGLVSGDVLLSAVVGRQPRWQRFSLPLRPETIERIQAFGDAEGLEPTLRRHRLLARRADRVFVWTDGQICDRPIDKAALHAQRIYTWGLYCGDRRDSVEQLKTYFDKALVAASAEQLVETMLLLPAA